MKLLPCVLLLVIGSLFSPLGLVAQSAAPKLAGRQLDEAFKSGFTTMVNQVVVPGAIVVKQPTLFEKSQAELEQAKKADVLKTFNVALTDVVKKVTPKAAEILRNEIKEMQVEDATALLQGGPKAGSEYLKKKLAGPMRDALLPVVRQTITSAELSKKGHAVVNAISADGVKGGAKAVVDLDYHIVKQVIEQSFQLVAKQEEAVRADPTLLKGNSLAQMAFTQFKK